MKIPNIIFLGLSGLNSASFIWVAFKVPKNQWINHLLAVGAPYYFSFLLLITGIILRNKAVEQNQNSKLLDYACHVAGFPIYSLLIVFVLSLYIYY